MEPSAVARASADPSGDQTRAVTYSGRGVACVCPIGEIVRVFCQEAVFQSSIVPLNVARAIKALSLVPEPCWRGDQVIDVSAAPEIRVGIALFPVAACHTCVV